MSAAVPTSSPRTCSGRSSGTTATRRAISVVFMLMFPFVARAGPT
jgi:hypothetical protein